MISLVGFANLLFSFLIGLIIFFSYFFNNKNQISRTYYNLFFFKFFFIIVSFLTLIYAYIVSDFSNQNVFENSHSDKPILYKITGTWGNHEGSMLLWLLIMSSYTLFFTFNKNLKDNIKKLTITFQTSLFLLFAVFVILTSNPFLINSINFEEGMGLNPILQDPALAVHPPILYIGYVGFSLILSLALAGLTFKQIDYEWMNTAKKLTLFCWSMLTGGIALGSYWAYYELGWGGWWFWDPVENVSLMPWIAGLALVHSLMITKKEKLLIRWIVFLSILCFSLSIFGTFLVRSGILTSVHSFATDSARGIFILIIFLVSTGFSFILFIFKTDDSEEKLKLLFINKSTALVFNNIVMIIACLTILLGTIYPIVIEVITNKRISVGAPYFNSTALPILLPGFLLMSIAPALSWQNNKLPKYKSYIFVFIALSFLSFIIVYLNTFNVWGFIGISLGLIIIFSSLLSVYFNYKKFGLRNFISHNNALLAHIGVGILILGITTSSVYKSEFSETFMINEKKQINNYSYTLLKLETNQDSNFQELVAVFSLYKDNKKIAEIKPSKRYYNVSKMITTEAGIYHSWFQDFYVIIGNEKDKIWSVKIYQNPLVSLIWIGVIIMVLSGFLGIRKV